MSLQPDQEGEVLVNDAKLVDKRTVGQGVDAPDVINAALRSSFTFFQQGSVPSGEDPGPLSKEDPDVRKDGTDGSSSASCQAPVVPADKDDKLASLTGEDLLYPLEQGSTGGIFDDVHPPNHPSRPSTQDGAYVSKFATFLRNNPGTLEHLMDVGVLVLPSFK